MFLGKIIICFCSDPVFHIQNKALAVVAVFDAFIGRVTGNCWLVLDIGLIIILEGTKSRERKTLEIVQCFVTCIDLPRRRNRIILYFKYLLSTGTVSAAFNFLFSLLSLAKSSDRYSWTVFHSDEDFFTIYLVCFFSEDLLSYFNCLCSLISWSFLNKMN